LKNLTPNKPLHLAVRMTNGGHAAQSDENGTLLFAHARISGTMRRRTPRSSIHQDE
jgi:hypothetical protein